METPHLPRGYIAEFKYIHRQYPDRPTLSLTMRSSKQATSGGVEVVFDGVSDLTVIDLNFLSSGECVLKARDVRDWQHEGVNYAVADFGEELFTFKCVSWNCVD